MYDPSFVCKSLKNGHLARFGPFLALFSTISQLKTHEIFQNTYKGRKLIPSYLGLTYQVRSTYVKLLFLRNPRKKGYLAVVGPFLALFGPIGQNVSKHLSRV